MNRPENKEQPVSVSLVLTVFNTRQYLPTMLDSLVAQSFRDFEVIIVDDGSPDGSEVVYDKYCAEDPRFRAYRQENKGISVARNVGLSMARGRIVGILDSDDLLHPDFLQQMVTVLEGADADIAVCGTLVFSDGRTPVFETNRNSSDAHVSDGITALTDLLTDRISPNVWNRLYRRPLLESERFSPKLYAVDDLEISIRLFLKARRVVKLPSMLYAYRKHAGSTLSAVQPRLFEDRIAVVGIIAATLEQAQLRRTLNSEFMALVVRHLAYFGMKDMVRTQRPDWQWFRRMRTCLKREYGLRWRSVFRLPVTDSVQKWAGIALLPEFIGKTFITYQRWRYRKNVR
jgi:glycosyltransferase involved in cell wall biosynthesis